MDYFENTTRITEDGYAAILQMQKKQHCIICRAIGILLAIPFLERLIYRGILLGIGDTADFHLGFLDFFFLSADGNYKMVTGKPGTLDYRKILKRTSGREMM